MAEPKETVHGGDIYRNPSVTDYSVNSNPLGVPEAVRKSVQESADRIMYYPDVRCDRLRESISDFERIEKEKILCGSWSRGTILQIKRRTGFPDTGGYTGTDYGRYRYDISVQSQ